MSKILKSVVIAAALSTMAVSPAWADRFDRGGGYSHHGGGRGGGDAWAGLGLGLLLGTAVYLATSPPPPPVYYRQTVPAPVYVQPAYSAPPVVVQQAYPPAPVVDVQNWWYYCSQPAGYYPYVKYCPTGWTRVAPTPPG